MESKEVLIPTKYELFMQDLSNDYLELKYLGYVRTFSEAKNMCKIFRDTLKDKTMTVLFRCVVNKENKDENRTNL